MKEYLDGILSMLGCGTSIAVGGLIAIAVVKVLLLAWQALF